MPHRILIILCVTLWGWAALIIGALGLIVGSVALVSSRRK